MTNTKIGRYEILRPLGRGAMGVVYLARDPNIEREVALKTVRFDTAGAGGFKVEEAKARFLKEARISGRLQHPNIVTIYDVGEDEGNLYLAMEYVAGGSLAQQLTDPSPLSVEERIRIILEVAHALGHAHERGVIHRDVKPANILLTPALAAKVSDFGIGKLLTGDTDLTTTGQMVGSPAYMSPEQIKGEKLDVRSDIFSLGIVLYQTLTLRKPFPADTLTTLVYQILHEEPPDPLALQAGLPPEIPAILRKCLSKNREDRYTDAVELAAELGEIIGYVPVSTTGALSESKVGRARRTTAVSVNAGLPPPPTQPPPPPAPMADPDAPTELVGKLGSDTPTIAVRSGAAARPEPAVADAKASPSGKSKAPLIAAAVAGLAVLTAAGFILARRGGTGGGAPPEPTPVAAVPAATPAAEPTPASATTAAAATASTATAPAPTAMAPTAVPPTPTAAAKHGPVAAPVSASPVPTKRVKKSPTPAVPPTATPPPPTATPRPANLTVHTRRFVKLLITPDQTRVFVNGKLVGIADDWDDAGGGALLTFLLPGKQRLRLAYPGYKDYVVDVVVGPSAGSDRADVKVQMERGTPEGWTGPEGNFGRPSYRTVGAVRFNVEPPSAVLVVNGKEFGPVANWKETDLTFQDQAVYDLSISAPGHETKLLRLIVSPSTKEGRTTVKERLKKF